MTTFDPNVVDTLLAQGLRERAADLGDEDRFYQQVLATISVQPQRRWFQLWYSHPAARWRLAGLEQAHRPLAFVLLAVALLITIVAGALIAGAGPLRRDPEEILTEREFVEPFLGLPPEGAAPSIPEIGDLVFSFYAEAHDSGVHDGLSMWLYEDGRLIWQRESATGRLSALGRLAFGTTEPTTAVIEQRLTPEGVELLRSEVLAVGRAGEHANKPGVWWRELLFHDGEQLVKMTWNDGWLPERLVNPASWLPPSAWADQRIGGYVPRRYAACTYPPDGLARLPSRARDLILAHATNRDGVVAGWDPACYLVPTEIAREFAATLEMAGIHLEEGSSSLGSVPGSPNDFPNIMVIPVSPDGKPMCLGCVG